MAVCMLLLRLAVLLVFIHEVKGEVVEEDGCLNRGLSNGEQGHPDDCSILILCLDGDIVYTYQCENGTMFSIEINACDIPTNSYCHYRDRLVDECTAGDHNCSVNADCKDTPGTFSCACSTGFEGDGYTCTDIDECLGNTSCIDQSYCNNTLGSYECFCDEGFTGNSWTCLDIDECQQNVCDVNANCENTNGSYVCTCKFGYTGDGASCNASTAQCFPNATMVLDNPDPGLFRWVLAIDNTNTICASNWTDSTKSTVEIRSCVLNEDILVHFTDRPIDPATDLILVDGYNAIFRCNDIPYAGVARAAPDGLSVTLSTAPEVAATPSFSVTSALRDSNGVETSTTFVGDVLTWTIDIPDEYSMLPITCTAYSGTDSSGSESKEFINYGCTLDASLVVSFSEIKVDQTISNRRRYYTDFYVFKFYNSEDLFIICTLKVCPPLTTTCGINCSGGRKRRSYAYNDEGAIHSEIHERVRVLKAKDSGTAPVCYSSFLTLVCALLYQMFAATA